MTTVLSFSNATNQEEFKARKAQIRDSIISILNSKRPEDLLKVEGKQYLKSEIKSAINSYFVDGEVQDVFYTSFQIN
jgi:flagellar FliL protein